MHFQKTLLHTFFCLFLKSSIAFSASFSVSFFILTSFQAHVSYENFFKKKRMCIFLNKDLYKNVFIVIRLHKYGNKK